MSLKHHILGGKLFQNVWQERQKLTVISDTNGSKCSFDPQLWFTQTLYSRCYSSKEEFCSCSGPMKGFQRCRTKKKGETLPPTADRQNVLR